MRSGQAYRLLIVKATWEHALHVAKMGFPGMTKSEIPETDCYCAESFEEPLNTRKSAPKLLRTQSFNLLSDCNGAEEEGIATSRLAIRAFR